jgi:hypothetical protein
MSRLQSLRLAQFWYARLRPLVSAFEKKRTTSGGDAFEAVGWLIEGVFCGFFDPHEADVVWIRITSLLEACGSPSAVVGETLSADIARLYESSEPFRQADQMTDGPQKQFELPLFQHALLLSDRLAHDSLAGLCSSVLRDEERWERLMADWHLAEGKELANSLADDKQIGLTPSSLAAGYVRLLEHMEASRSFFQYAKFHSPPKSDFESYCRRIGGLDAWRIPLNDWAASERFKALPNLLEFALRPEIEKMSHAEWSDFEKLFSSQLSTLIEAWETHHLSQALAVA